MRFFTLWILCLFALSEGNAFSIYVFGDSHSREFAKIRRCKPISLGPRTMHRIGRDGLSILDIRNHGVQEKDVVVFSFGEIDVRCHIGKQCDIHNRALDEVIQTLAANYFQTIIQNRAFYKELTCIVYSVTPPTDVVFNSDYPRFGHLMDRVEISKKLNAKLSELCEKHGLLFLDVYDEYANPDGTLNLSLSDGNVHIHCECSGAISEKLLKLLAKN